MCARCGAYFDRIESTHTGGAVGCGNTCNGPDALSQHRIPPTAIQHRQSIDRAIRRVRQFAQSVYRSASSALRSIRRIVAVLAGRAEGQRAFAEDHQQQALLNHHALARSQRMSPRHGCCARLEESAATEDSAAKPDSLASRRTAETFRRVRVWPKTSRLGWTALESARAGLLRHWRTPQCNSAGPSSESRSRATVPVCASGTPQRPDGGQVSQAAQGNGYCNRGNHSARTGVTDSLACVEAIHLAGVQANLATCRLASNTPRPLSQVAADRLHIPLVFARAARRLRIRRPSRGSLAILSRSNVPSEVGPARRAPSAGLIHSARPSQPGRKAELPQVGRPLLSGCSSSDCRTAPGDLTRRPASAVNSPLQPTWAAGGDCGDTACVGAAFDISAESRASEKEIGVHNTDAARALRRIDCAAEQVRLPEEWFLIVLGTRP